MPRGIQNVSGVSCHIACALQLVAHSVPRLTQLFQLQQEQDYQDSLVKEIGKVLCSLVNDDDSSKDDVSALDPTRLYRLLQETSVLNPEDVGDVSTAIYTLWQVLQQINDQWKAVIEYLVLNGQTQQVICGKKIHGDRVIVRTKLAKVKRMASPFPLLLLENNESVNEALFCAVQASSGTLVEDYDWDSQSQTVYTEETVPIENNASQLSSNEWTTTKTMQILCVPHHFLISLDRFRFTSKGGERVWKHARLQVSPHMELLGGQTFRLVGAVLHVNEQEDSLEEEGHYATLVNTTRAQEEVEEDSSQGSSCWTLIDDDSCQEVDSVVALNWINGAADKSGTQYYCAVLLAYRSNDCHFESDEWESLVARLTEQTSRMKNPSSSSTTNAVDWSQPESLVGRRLKVKWAKGKFYEGVVDGYDATTGKHRVLYNDGDEREYILSKKTIEWI